MTINLKVKERIERVTIHGWNRLDLKNCGLKEFPLEVLNCPDLMFIDLSNDIYCDNENRNIIKVIPDEIKRLKKLSRLDISNNTISIVPESISQLKNLKYLNLSNNEIRDLPSDVANLENLEELYLEGNPFDMLPPEIVARGVQSIRHFFIELDQKDFIYEVKLIIVGEGRVGKTCISKGLIESDYSLGDEKSTEGINIEPWIIPSAEIKLMNPKIQRDLQINVWDFGGQEIYHSTHQFFLTKRSVYMLVTESRKEDRHEDFYYWLNIIKLLGDESPIILVLNKCDQPTKEIPFKEYQEQFTNLVKFYKISLKEEFRSEFNLFKNEIIKIASNLPHIGNPLPKVWVDVRIEIENLKSSGTNYISETEYLEICM